MRFVLIFHFTSTPSSFIFVILFLVSFHTSILFSSFYSLDFLFLSFFFLFHDHFLSTSMIPSSRVTFSFFCFDQARRLLLCILNQKKYIHGTGRKRGVRVRRFWFVCCLYRILQFVFVVHTCLHFPAGSVDGYLLYTFCVLGWML